MEIIEPGARPPEASKAGKHRRRAGGLIGIVISVVCLYFVLRQLDIAALWRTVSGFDPALLLGGLAALVFGYAMRIVRWALMLRAGGARVAILRCAAPFMGSMALNNVLPLRAGDVVRALVFPAAIGAGKVTAAASLVLERLLDLLTLLAVLGAGLLLSPGLELPQAAKEIAVILSLCGVVALIGFMRFGNFTMRQLMRLGGWMQQRSMGSLASGIGVLGGFVADLQSMVRRNALVTAGLLSVFVWAGESGLIWALLNGSGISAAYPAALVVTAMVTLSTLVPSSPGYIGPFHLAGYAAATMLGATPETAAGFSVIAHLGLWLPVTLAGTAVIMFNRRLFAGADQMSRDI
ncbi:MAG: flippase-like domain-containing protein [Alphaproteobacteria bacterium]|nr:flippase-like domain-containing protein [Alphaproteobacteria bacterium]